MQYNYKDLGQQRRGTIIQVNLTGNAANVRLLDRPNFRAFQGGQRSRGVGGQYNRSPVQLQVPHDGHWYVVIDYGGYAGRGTASVQVLGVAS